MSGEGPNVERIKATCCVVGGGPAGMMLGYLLARAGVDVVVLEKHVDFFRDFRGDTIHPSTLEVLHELGILDDFLKLPYQETPTIGGRIEDFEFIAADFSHLPVKCKFIALIPQWDFLDFLARQAKRYPTFQLKMGHEATGLIREGEHVVGVRAASKEGPVEIQADLVVACDGRSSKMREESKLEVTDLGAPFDVLWMRLSRHPDDRSQSLGNFTPGKILVMINRKDYWQCAYLIAKGSFDRIKQEGLAAFQEKVASIAPYLRERMEELDSWDKIKLLTVQVNRMIRWHLPGLLCIGDAAHAMSPMGGVGINLAIQDAVAAANVLAGPLREQRVTEDLLQRVQKRRELPTRWTQGLQVFMQERVLPKVLDRTTAFSVPLVPRLLKRWPFLRRIPGQIVGMGFRPEHVHTLEATRPS
jgi:2-polyprenyl-6-methoxyphenol hydroxylase-like FAD-dependent oxidoreductase